MMDYMAIDGVNWADFLPQHFRYTLKPAKSVVAKVALHSTIRPNHLGYGDAHRIRHRRSRKRVAASAGRLRVLPRPSKNFTSTMSSDPTVLNNPVNIPLNVNAINAFAENAFCLV